MEANVGTTDRSVRLVVGAVLALAGITGFAGLWGANTIVAALLVLVGVVLLGTGLTRQCLLYRPLGIDTR